jgi:SNF2 family DNA or RNA helicase
MCLADDMGLGKTFTALALFMYFLKCKKIMIVCPGINIETWVKQFEKFDGFCKKDGGKVRECKLFVIDKEMDATERYNAILEWWSQTDSGPQIIIIWSYS